MGDIEGLRLLIEQEKEKGSKLDKQMSREKEITSRSRRAKEEADDLDIKRQAKRFEEDK